MPALHGRQDACRYVAVHGEGELAFQMNSYGLAGTIWDLRRNSAEGNGARERGIYAASRSFTVWCSKLPGQMDGEAA